MQFINDMAAVETDSNNDRNSEKKEGDDATKWDDSFNVGDDILDWTY